LTHAFFFLSDHSAVHRTAAKASLSTLTIGYVAVDIDGNQDDRSE
jgi:hypothetical protein